MNWRQWLFMLTLFVMFRSWGCQVGLPVVLTGRSSPIYRIEHLQHARRVAAVGSASLVLEGNQRVRLPDHEFFSAYSRRALEWLVERGVEISPDGRVYGLAKIHHWCGNDPVAREVVRVDLADVLTYLQQSGLYRKCRQTDPAQDVCHDYSGAFSPRGWMVEEYFDFQQWRHASRRSEE